MSLRQKILMLATAALASISVLYLQQRFDAADVKSAIAIAETYRAPSGRTLVDVLEARHPKSAVAWSGTEVSSCFQHVRVDANVTPPGDGAPLLYQFAVDLNGPSLHPANPLGVEAIAALDIPSTPTPTPTSTPTSTSTLTPTTTSKP